GCCPKCKAGGHGLYIPIESRLRDIAEENNLAMLEYDLFYDGASTFNQSLWTLVMSINGYIPKLLVMPWAGYGHPPNSMLGRFVNEIKGLHNAGGVLVRGERVPLVPRVCIADSPARADIRGAATHRGYFGCPYCLNPGRNIGPVGHTKMVFPNGQFPL